MCLHSFVCGRVAALIVINTAWHTTDQNIYSIATVTLRSELYLPYDRYDCKGIYTIDKKRDDILVV